MKAIKNIKRSKTGPGPSMCDGGQKTGFYNVLTYPIHGGGRKFWMKSNIIIRAKSTMIISEP